MDAIPFNRPYLTGNEIAYIGEAAANLHLSGNGPFTRRCAAWICERSGSAAALLTHSATGALEMAVALADIRPGDEVVMPSFTFVSTANAVVLRGGVPVFVDIRSDTLNLDETLVEDAVTARTKAIMPVHYAGVGCDMAALLDVGHRHSVAVIEDAAHGIMSTYDGRALGSYGALGALSFHETKNVMCGEGGALMINDASLIDRAEVVLEKGTNRKRFYRGQVDKYSWVDIGSSYVMSEINAAFLWAQLEHADVITSRRLQIWNAYDEAFRPLAEEGLLGCPVVPHRARHNAHMYYLILPETISRSKFLAQLLADGVHAVFHYVPLHSSSAGTRYGRTGSTLKVTEDVSERLVRLPLWVGMRESEVGRVIDSVLAAAGARATGVR
ncbi:MAG: dTDP-4-amino-4,6-dideoxygalactose transaminase [Actinobacteria bacterium]|nr:dTDP-4-amino-4,6-dideoxygalactose transaminase [Actinomycetota bacterium]